MTYLRMAILALTGILWSSVAHAQAPVIPCISQVAGGCTPVVSTNPLPVAIYNNGSTAQVSLDGAMSVNTPASPQFQDSFSSALDTTTNWIAKNSTGTAATASGQLVINSSTTASAWGGVSTQQTFAPVGVGSQAWGVLASFTVLAQANSVRVFGVFTAPVGPITIAGLTGSSQVYQGSASAAGGTVAGQTFQPCIPASAVNTNITVTTTADGTATAVNVNSWGFRQ